MTPGAPTNTTAAQITALALHQPAVGQTLFMAKSYVALGPPPFSLPSQTGIGTPPAMYGNILYTSEGFSDAVVWQVPPQAPNGGATMLIPQVPYLWSPGFYYQSVPSAGGPSTIPSVGPLMAGIMPTGYVFDGAGYEGPVSGTSLTLTFPLGYTGDDTVAVAIAVQQSQPSTITVTDSAGNAYTQVEQLVIPSPAWVLPGQFISGEVILTVFLTPQYANVPPGTVVTVSGFVSGDNEGTACGLVLFASDPFGYYTLTQPETVQLYPDPTNQAPYAILSTLDPWQYGSYIDSPYGSIFDGAVFYVSFACIAGYNGIGPLPIGGATPTNMVTYGERWGLAASIGTTIEPLGGYYASFGNAISVGWMTTAQSAWVSNNGSPLTVGGQVVLVMPDGNIFPKEVLAPGDVLQYSSIGLWTTGPPSQNFSAAVFTGVPTERHDTTGAGTALLGANCPATTPTAPYTWMEIITSDGSSGFIPIWK